MKFGFGSWGNGRPSRSLLRPQDRGRGTLLTAHSSQPPCTCICDCGASPILGINAGCRQQCFLLVGRCRLFDSLPAFSQQRPRRMARVGERNPRNQARIALSEQIRRRNSPHFHGGPFYRDRCMPATARERRTEAKPRLDQYRRTGSSRLVGHRRFGVQSWAGVCEKRRCFRSSLTCRAVILTPIGRQTGAGQPGSRRKRARPDLRTEIRKQPSYRKLRQPRIS